MLVAITICVAIAIQAIVKDKTPARAKYQPLYRYSISETF